MYLYVYLDKIYYRNFFVDLNDACVEMYPGVEQMTTDTTSKYIKDYYHKNDRIKHVKTSFEALFGDVEDVGVDVGVERGVNICYRLLHAVFAGGIVSTHRLQLRI